MSECAVADLRSADVQATFCAALVDEWIAAGIRHAVVCPGSRSTPMALALSNRPELAIHVVHDERAAAFIALGLGTSGIPSLLLCTSGTATVNFHPAVVEAGLSGVPMVVLTADRPPELHGVGASQTIDQQQLYGSSVTRFVDAGVPDAAERHTWRPLARVVLEFSRRGPVQLNLPFREPLVGAVVESLTPEPVTERLGESAHSAPMLDDADRQRLDELLGRSRGLIVAGGTSGVARADVESLARVHGFPILADPLSSCRAVPRAVTAFDAMLRSARFADSHRPEVVVRIGRPPASRVLSEFVVASGAPVIQVGGPGRIDPDANVAVAVDAIGPLLHDLSGVAVLDGWASGWELANRAAEAALAGELGASPTLTEPAVARLVALHRGDAQVVVAASMPMRDYEWYGGPKARAFANRGANGIDGVVSTALGIALQGRRVIAVVGDIAFVHDSSALIGLAGRGVDLHVVVVDNDGGGIFSFLPQAQSLATERFERLFGTPHGTDVVTLARAHRLDAVTAVDAADLVARLGQPGAAVTRVASTRADNVGVHRRLNAVVAAALEVL